MEDPKGIAEVLKLLKEIFALIGPGWALAFFAAAILLPWAKSAWSGRQDSKGIAAHLNTQEMTIQRLANDNRSLRRQLLLLQGHSEEKIRFIEASNVEREVLLVPQPPPGLFQRLLGGKKQ